jgi:3-oxoacyl-[acyl-carrier protein] reductase
MRLSGKTAIITGGARGIGYAYAEAFLREGASVAIADVKADLAESAAKELSEKGTAVAVTVDVSDRDSCVACVKNTVDALGGVDILMNNAAIYGDWDTADQSVEYLKRMFDVNLHGSWLMAGAVAPAMVKRGGGRIVNQASGAAYNYASMMPGGDYPGLPSFNYSQTKWGVIGLTKFLAGYLGKWNITVNCIAPGVVATEATVNVVGEENMGRIGATQPIAGQIQVEDITGAAVFFASNDARFISGQVLVIDGGRHMPA